MVSFQETKHESILPGEYVLGADVGGTNTTFGVLTSTGKISLILTMHYRSDSISDFTIIFQEVLSYLQKEHGIMVAKACLAVAGPVTEKGSYCQLTHLPWAVDARVLQGTTGKEVLLINDFEAIGYGLGALPLKDFTLIKPGNAAEHAPKAVLGAGTFLGKVVMVWDEQDYIPIASEGGHGDLAVQDKLEWNLLQFIREKEQGSVAWGDILSGKGIGYIYEFLSRSRSPLNLAVPTYEPALISNAHARDELCREAMALWVKFYARAAKNLALEVLAHGGIYIAGGIAAQHPEIFSQYHFTDEFMNSKKLPHLLKEIPVRVITNYLVGLYGTAVALRRT